MAKKKQRQHKRAAAERVARKPAKERLRQNGKRAPLPPKGKSWQPGTPGVPNPTIEPFFTPNDLLAINDFQTNESMQLSDLDASLDNARIERDYNLTQAADQYKQNTAAATDEMIGRGLFSSSVKDAALYDMEATLGLQRTFLNDRFNQLLSDATAKKDLILGAGGARERFWSAMNQQKVENARQASEGMLPWKVEPGQGKWVPTPAAPKPPTPAAPGNPANQTLAPGPRGGKKVHLPRPKRPDPGVHFDPRPKRQAKVRRISPKPAQERLVNRG